MIKIEVSFGEVFDKLSILGIKKEKIKDPEKLKQIQFEVDAISSSLQELVINKDQTTIMVALIAKLKEINNKLWDAEDVLRECDKNKDYGDKFVEAAKKDINLNDDRFVVKRKINEALTSAIKETKSYDGL